MASVFLSYDRDDAERAKTIARALERGGHSVWWDRHIKGGAEFAQEIEQELAKAAAVVVLWSERSIRSAWVRDEAAEGRDKGKLIPVSLDGTSAPMGFRQYQGIDLSAPRSERGSEMRRLLDAIDGLAAQLTLEDVRREPRKTVRTSAPANWQRYALAVAVVVAIGGGGLWLSSRPTDMTSVSIAASEPGPGSNKLARDLLVKLSSLQGHNESQFRILTGNMANSADLLFQVALRPEAGSDRASLALVSRKGDEILWSGELHSKTGQFADLEQQLAYSAARILDCAQHALAPGAKLPTQTVKTYLDGCARIAELIGSDPSQIQPLFEQVTRDAPNFTDGWAKLLLIYSSSALPEEMNFGERNDVRMKDAITRARAVDPAMPEVALAEIAMLPPDALEQRFRLLDRAVARHPANPNLLVNRAAHLAAIGRWSAAIADSRLAAEADPLNPAFENAYILNLAFAGQAPMAFKELERADTIWPGASNLRTTRFWLNFRFGDPRIALDLLQQGVARLPSQVQLVLQARIDPAHGNLERARSFIRQALQTNLSAGPVQGAAALGIEQELWPILLARPRLGPGTLTVLMQPAFRTFRQDPRFIAVAARTNVLAYWRSSGRWPDFCRDTDLRYDCNTEAAKLR